MANCLIIEEPVDSTTAMKSEPTQNYAAGKGILSDEVEAGGRDNRVMLNQAAAVPGKMNCDVETQIKFDASGFAFIDCR